jgi:hypothetical protein
MTRFINSYLPMDIIGNIFTNLDYKNINKLCQLSKETNTYCKQNKFSLLYNLLKKKTSLNLENFTFDELSFLCKTSVLEDNRILLSDEITMYGANLLYQNIRIDTKYTILENNILKLEELLDTNKIHNDKIYKIKFIGGRVFDYKTLIIITTNHNAYLLNNTNGIVSFSSPISNGISKTDKENVIDIAGNATLFFLDTKHDLYKGKTKILENIVQISGEKHILALSEFGYVYSFGNNEYGQLGNSSLLSNSQPVVVNGLNNIYKVFTTNTQSFCLTKDGKVYYFGENNKSVLTVPTLIKDLNNIADISIGNKTYFLDYDGKVFTYCDNQLITYDELKCIVKIYSNENSVMFISKHGSFHVINNNNRKKYTIL